MNKICNLLSCCIVSIAIGVVSIGCGAPAKKIKADTGDVKDAVSIYPKEIEQVIAKKYSKSIHAVGIGSHPDKAIAVKKARLDAQNQIANIFKNDVSALQKSFLEAVNNEKLDEYKNTVESFTNVELQGVVESKALVTEGKDGFSSYILLTVSAETLKNMIDQKINAQTSMKALKAYKELEDRVLKDNEFRAANPSD